MKNRLSLIVVGMSALAVGFGVASIPQDRQPTPPGQDVPQLPPGMTEQDMQAVVIAATPGEQHEWLAEGAGTWDGKTKMWMAPNTEPQVSACTAVVEVILGGRFTTCTIEGDMPGMGPFTGFGIYGYDNVAQTFQSSWVDNMGTTMMIGTGARSSDGKSLEWTYTYTCPIQQGPTTMREVETITGENTRTLSMYATDPTTGNEFKVMEVSLTRTGRGAIGAE